MARRSQLVSKDNHILNPSGSAQNQQYERGANMEEKQTLSIALSVIMAFFIIGTMINNAAKDVVPALNIVHSVILALDLVILLVECIRKRKSIVTKGFRFIPTLSHLIFYLYFRSDEFVEIVILKQYSVNFAYKASRGLFALGILIFLIAELPQWLFPSKQVYSRKVSIAFCATSVSVLLLSVIVLFVL